VKRRVSSIGHVTLREAKSLLYRASHSDEGRVS
jgi:hypothetical protein